ncbi:MAG: sulfate ABC transporter substrate-binding protein, partial [Betaproteobacteria bacterium HGW-Betaproteobacteria-4]
PPVAVVDGNSRKHGTEKVAEAYVKYLYSPVGQKLAARHYYRPIKPELADPADVARFPKLDLIKIDKLGGWQAVQKKHFADGGVFDQLYRR